MTPYPNHLFQISIKRRLQAPGPRAWSAVEDFGGNPSSNAFIESSRITNGERLREGAEREVRLYDGSVMEQRVVDYRPGKSVVLEVIQTDQWVRHHVVELSVNAESKDASCIDCRVSFQPPLGPLGVPIGLIYKAILRSQYSHILRGIVRDTQRQHAADRYSGKG